MYACYPGAPPPPSSSSSSSSSSSFTPPCTIRISQRDKDGKAVSGCPSNVSAAFDIIAPANCCSSIAPNVTISPCVGDVITITYSFPSLPASFRASLQLLLYLDSTPAAFSPYIIQITNSTSDNEVLDSDASGINVPTSLRPKDTVAVMIELLSKALAPYNYACSVAVAASVSFPSSSFLQPMQLSSCSGNRITLIYPNISALGPQLQISLFLMGSEVKGSPFAVTILEEVDPRNCVVEGVAHAVAGDGGCHAAAADYVAAAADYVAAAADYDSSAGTPSSFKVILRSPSMSNIRYPPPPPSAHSHLTPHTPHLTPHTSRLPLQRMFCSCHLSPQPNGTHLRKLRNNQNTVLIFSSAFSSTPPLCNHRRWHWRRSQRRQISVRGGDIHLFICGHCCR
jgi:hypothetical protein